MTQWVRRAMGAWLLCVSCGMQAVQTNSESQIKNGSDEHYGDAYSNTFALYCEGKIAYNIFSHLRMMQFELYQKQYGQDASLLIAMLEAVARTYNQQAMRKAIDTVYKLMGETYEASYLSREIEKKDICNILIDRGYFLDAIITLLYFGAPQPDIAHLKKCVENTIRECPTCYTTFDWVKNRNSNINLVSKLFPTEQHAWFDALSQSDKEYVRQLQQSIFTQVHEHWDAHGDVDPHATIIPYTAPKPIVRSEILDKFPAATKYSSWFYTAGKLIVVAMVAGIIALYWTHSTSHTHAEREKQAEEKQDTASTITENSKIT